MMRGQAEGLAKVGRVGSPEEQGSGGAHPDGQGLLLPGRTACIASQMLPEGQEA